MADKLSMGMLNALPHPICARFIGSKDIWPIWDICVETGLMRIDVVGKLEIKIFAEVRERIDANGLEYDADQFWLECGERDDKHQASGFRW